MRTRPWWLRLDGFPPSWQEKKTRPPENDWTRDWAVWLPVAGRDYPGAPNGRAYKVRARARGVPDLSGGSAEGPILLGAWLFHSLVFWGQWNVEVADLVTEKVYPVASFRSRKQATNELAPLRSAIEEGTWTPPRPR